LRHYWDDIDTHGFARVSKLRASLPHASSILMDRETLLSHRALWVREEEPCRANLSGLTEAELELFDDLRNGSRLRDAGEGSRRGRRLPLADRAALARRAWASEVTGDPDAPLSGPSRLLPNTYSRREPSSDIRVPLTVRAEDEATIPLRLEEVEP
jgi:hypothetical protein